MSTPGTMVGRSSQEVSRARLFSVQHVLLALLVISLLTRNEVYFGDARVAMYLFLTVAGLLLVLRSLATGRVPRIPLVGLVIALVAAAMVSLIHVADVGRSLDNLRWLVTGVSVYVVITTHVRSWKGLHVAVWSLVAVAVVQAAVSIGIVATVGHQFFWGGEQRLINGFGLGVEGINLQAHFYLAGFTFVAVWLARTRFRSARAVNLLLVLSLIILETALILILNRTSLVLSWLVIVGLLFLTLAGGVRPAAAMKTVLLGAVAVVVGFWALNSINPEIIDRLEDRFEVANITEERDQNRQTRWRRSLQEISEHPFGVGLKNFRDTIGFVSPTSLYLEVLLGLGIQGLIVLLLFFGTMSLRLLRTLNRLPPGNQRVLAMAVGINFLVILLVGLIDSLLVQPLLWYVLALAALVPYLPPPIAAGSAPQAPWNAGSVGRKGSRL